MPNGPAQGDAPQFEAKVRSHRNRSITRYLIALVISSLIPGAAAVIYVHFKDIQRRTETNRREAKNLVIAMGSSLDRALGELEGDLTLLTGLSSLAPQPSEPARATAVALAQRGHYHLLLVDAQLNARWASNSAASPLPPALAEDVNAVLKDGKIRVTDRIATTANPGSGGPTFAAIARASSAHGKPLALVALPDRDWFSPAFLNKIRVGWQWRIYDAQSQEVRRRQGRGDLAASQIGGSASFVHYLRRTGWRVEVELPIADVEVPLSHTPAIPALAGGISLIISLFLATQIARKARVARVARNASDDRLRMAMKMGAMVAFTLDRDLRFTWFHSSHPDLEQIVVGQNETELFAPETAGVLSAMHHQVLNRGMEVRRDVMVQIKSKLKQRYFDLMLRPLFDEAGDISGVVGIAIDITDRKRTERRLRESQEDLHLAQAVARTGSWRLNIWTNELVWSEEAWRIFGVPRQDKLTYDRYLEAIHPEDRSRVAQKWIDALHGEPYDIDHRIVVGDEVRWVRQLATLEYDDQGVLVGGFGTAQDITERKQLTEELRQREQYLRAVLDNLPFVLWLKDERSRFLAVNSHFAKTFGWPSVESLVGKNDFHVAPTDLALASRDADKDVLKSGASKHTEELMFVDGEYHWFETYKSPVILDGHAIGTVGYARDVSQRRLMESRLRESEAFNVAVLNALTEHIAVLDEYGTIVAVNAAWKQFALSNGTPELANNSVGLSYRDASVSALGQQENEEGQNAWQGINRVIRGLQSHFACEYACPSSKEDRYFRMSVYPLPAPRRGAVVAHEDITARKRAEEALKRAMAKAEHANEAKSRFLAAASHDLRQPLSALALYVGMLGSRLATEDAVLMRNMKDCLTSLNELLSNLLDLSMLEAGVTKPEIRDFPLSEMFSKAISIHAPEANMKGLMLRCAHTRIAARTDPVLFGRMLRNLVANAVRYTEQGGVLVGCRRRGGRLWVEVWDTGIGIPAEKTGEIFEEFKQLGNDERSRGKGSGLGLAIVAKTAALLGLEIRVRSVLGRGSMFAVEIPPGEATEVELPQQGACRPLWIGLVENDPAVLEALTRSLESIGHHVVDASSGDELLELLDGIPPDLVISDYRLNNGESGFGVVKRLRKLFERDVPALVITGDTDSMVMRHMAKEGIRVLHKPLELETLQECMAELTATAEEPAAALITE